MISPANSDKIVMWRFLRNRRLILRLHTIFWALTYTAHRAVVPAIAWHLVGECYYCCRFFYLLLGITRGIFIEIVHLHNRLKVTQGHTRTGF